jgi:DNA integrity scanning protein DisA with diadenylate cyclase activity
MGLPKQTIALLDAARDVVRDKIAEMVLLLTETDLDWEEVRAHLKGCQLLVAAENEAVTAKLREETHIDVIELDPEPIPTTERMSLALLKAIALEKVTPGSHVVVLYNGIAASEEKPEPIDSLSLVHLGEHLERLTAQDLRRLNTPIPLDTLRLVVDLASEIGREGREGKPVGTILVVGDTRKVQSMSQPINFNPFRGYSKVERDLRDRRVREQIKDIAQLDGAIFIDRDAIAIAACQHLNVPAEGVSVSKGFGSRHRAAAAISRKTGAIAVCVSQSSGTVRLFQDGEVVLHIEPLARPHIWQPFRLETQEDGQAGTPRED